MSNSEWSFLYAAENGNLVEVKKIVERNTINNINDCKDVSGMNALHRASSGGHIKVVEYLLANTNIDPTNTNKDQDNALIIASWKGHLSVVEYLIVHTIIDPNSHNKNGSNALHKASVRGHFDIVEYLITKTKINPTAIDSHGCTALHYAAQNGNLPSVEFLLKNTSIDPNSKDKEGDNALHEASKQGHLAVVEYLVKNTDIDPTSINEKGENALHQAASTGRLLVVKYLLTDTSIIASSTDKNGSNALHLASINGHLSVVEWLLDNTDIDPTATQSLGGTTALYLACSNSHRSDKEQVKKSIQELIKRAVPASYNHKNSLFKAVKDGDLPQIWHVISLPDVASTIHDMKDENGRNILLLAAFLGHLDVVKYLLNTIGMDMGSKDKNGWNILQVAAAGNQMTVLQYLAQFTFLHQCMIPVQIIDPAIITFLYCLGAELSMDAKRELWKSLVQSDHPEHLTATYELLQREPTLYQLTDEEDRLIADFAVPEVQAVFKDMFLWFGRYRKLEERAEHQSANCYVFKAQDERNGEKRVALKLMLNKEQFLREISLRRQYGFSDDYVMNILGTHPETNTDSTHHTILTDIDTSTMPTSSDQLNKKTAESLYCITLPLAERNLFVASKQERFTGRDWVTIRAICHQLLEAVQHMHSKGVIHGDIKPLNIVRVDGRWKLIDLDASLPFGQFTGIKYSTAFNPPEAIYCNKSSSPPLVEVKSEKNRNMSKQDYNLIAAAPSFDIWSLGCVFYTLFTENRMLLQGDQDDNLDTEQLIQLVEWSDPLKTRKLALVQDSLARNLLSQMLMREPKQRPSIDRLLQHPFFTGKKVSRLRGDEAAFDVFISYRVWSDAGHVQDLYDRLTAKGLRVWWDKICLKDGENWEQGFCAGLVDSRLFVPILSKNGLSNFTKLEEGSPCDNVLLEHRLALELQEMGLLEGIFPIIMGDAVNGDAAMRKIIWSGVDSWLPVCKDVCVAKVEEGTCHHLLTQALGSPLEPNRTVLSVMEEMKKMQGALVDGDYQDAMRHATDRIVHWVQERTHHENVSTVIVDDLGRLLTSCENFPVEVRQSIQLHIDKIKMLLNAV